MYSITVAVLIATRIYSDALHCLPNFFQCPTTKAKIKLLRRQECISSAKCFPELVCHNCRIASAETKRIFQDVRKSIRQCFKKMVLLLTFKARF